MKRRFTFFFLLIMTLNVAIPLVEQLRGWDQYELTEAGTDDTDEEGNTEKEKEKESLAFSHDHALLIGAFNLTQFRKSLFFTDELPLSELYASLPELPPEA